MVIDFFAWLLFVATLIFIGLIFPVYTLNEVFVFLSNLVIKCYIKSILFTFMFFWFLKICVLQNLLSQLVAIFFHGSGSCLVDLSGI